MPLKKIDMVDIFNTTNKYSIIYADPPWAYHAWSGDSIPSRKYGTAKSHYPTMKKQNIQALPVKDIAAKDCVLFLWVTMPCLEEGLELIKAWGFKYKTCGFTWVKRNKKAESYFTGLGYWTRANAELCLIATKGSPKRVSKKVPQICDARIREHSRKPDEIRERIVELCGDLPRIELFSRQAVSGWDCWGNETDHYEPNS